MTNPNPLRQIGWITDYQQGNVISTIPLPGNHDGLISIAKDKSLRIWKRRQNDTQYWSAVQQYLIICPTCIHLDKSALYAFVGAEDGAIYMYKTDENFESLTLQVRLTGHEGPVIAVTCDFTTVYYKDWNKNVSENSKINLENCLIISTAKDKTMNWYNAKTGRKIGQSSRFSSVATAMTIDILSRTIFIGTEDGSIYQIVIDQSNSSKSKLTSKWTAHDKTAINSLNWFMPFKALVSTCNENWTGDGAEIKIWFIGGGKGKKMILCALTPRVNIVHCSMFVRSNDSDKFSLLCLNKDGQLVKFNWENKTYRQREAPIWLESNLCQHCRRPFLWNVKECWKLKIVGVRQHHCRGCGKALCFECLNPQKRKIPIYGFETKVYMCKKCFPVEKFQFQPVGPNITQNRPNETFSGFQVPNDPLSEPKDENILDITPTEKPKLNYGTTIISEYSMNFKNISSCFLNYEKRWLVATLKDSSIRIFDISGIL